MSLKTYLILQNRNILKILSTIWRVDASKGRRSGARNKQTEREIGQYKVLSPMRININVYYRLTMFNLPLFAKHFKNTTSFGADPIIECICTVSR